MPAVFEHGVAARWDFDPQEIMRQLAERGHLRGTDVVERALVICRLLDSDRDAVDPMRDVAVVVGHEGFPLDGNTNDRVEGMSTR